jgi:lysophospholipase L1-like esterase
LLAGGLLAGCGEGRVTPPEQNLFERYVALGNSITAGVQSDGLNDSTQAQTYPVMLAPRANATFNYALANPNQLRKCQGMAGASTAEQAVAVLRTTCPYPGAPNFFGALVSFDAIHPSAEGHRLIADVIAAALRAKHGISL